VPNAFNKVVSREGRNEFQVLIAAMSTLLGFAQVVFNRVPTSLASLPPAYHAAWAWFMLIGGLCVLLSTFWHEPEGFSLFMEMGGLLLVGSTCLAYGVAIVITADDATRTVSGPLLIAVALACYSRTFRVARAVFKPRDEKLKEEVKARLAQQTDVAAEVLIREHQEGTTGEMPIIRPRESDNEGE